MPLQPDGIPCTELFSWNRPLDAWKISVIVLLLSSRCNFSLTEKFWILLLDKCRLLNKRSELLTSCRQANKSYAAIKKQVCSTGNPSVSINFVSTVTNAQSDNRFKRETRVVSILMCISLCMHLYRSFLRLWATTSILLCWHIFLNFFKQVNIQKLPVISL